MTEDKESFSLKVEITQPSFITDSEGNQFDTGNTVQTIDHGPVEEDNNPLFGEVLTSLLGVSMVSGVQAGSVALVAGTLCGLSLVYLIKFIWFLELITYLIFINANFGQSLSKQHRTLYDIVHFDLIPNINEYLFSIRENENSYFFKGKITEIGVSGFLSTNAGLEFIPLLIVLFLSSAIFTVDFLKKEIENIRHKEDKVVEKKNGGDSQPKWRERLNSVRFGLLLGSLIEYWLFV